MSTTTRTDTYTFTLASSATDTLAAMLAHVQALGRDWGESSPQYLTAAASLGRQVTMLFARPMTQNTEVWRDGPLSLLVTGGITFGIIWHGEKRRCLTEGCGAVINDDGTAWTYSKVHFPMLDHEHELSYPLTVAQPGSWSFHS